MRRLFLLILIIFCSSSIAAVYKWVDQSGTVHYSDQPQKGAEKIILPEPTVYTSRPAPNSSAGRDVKDRKKTPVTYTAFSIIAPSNRETIRSGSVEVLFQLSPSLQPGHYIQVILNGKIMDRQLTGPVLQLEGLDRGGYMVHATVHNAAGLMQIRSNIIQFFVQIETILDDGEAPAPPESGSSGQQGVDAPQYKPGDPADFTAGDKDAADFDSDENASTPGKTNPGFIPEGGSNPFPSTPGQTNPAFKPNF